MSRIPDSLKNKYVISLIVFIIWLAFFDRNDMITQVTGRQKLDKLQQDKEYYTHGIKENQEELDELESSKTSLEKFAREKYFMKKDNEEVFLIIKEEE
jgi:cell division protein FtsB